jgi:hypothetical protein
MKAEEFLIRRGCQRMKCNDKDPDYFEDVQPIDLIEFAKMHVEAALKEASEKARGGVVAGANALSEDKNQNALAR